MPELFVYYNWRGKVGKFVGTFCLIVLVRKGWKVDRNILSLSSSAERLESLRELFSIILARKGWKVCGDFLSLCIGAERLESLSELFVS